MPSQTLSYVRRSKFETAFCHIIHSQKWWVLCSFAYLRWRRRDVCNLHMIYIDDIIHNCMCVIFWTWKWYIESSWIKWNKNQWKQLNIRGSWTKWKSEATNPFLALRVYVKMSEIHETWWRVTQNLTMNDIWRHIFWN